MIWRPWRKACEGPALPAEEVIPRPGGDVRAANARAEAELIAARSRWPAVRHLAETLRELRQENHFGERIFGDGSEGGRS